MKSKKISQKTWLRLIRAALFVDCLSTHILSASSLEKRGRIVLASGKKSMSRLLWLAYRRVRLEISSLSRRSLPAEARLFRDTLVRRM